LEERERAARQRVEALQAELREAEAVWEGFVITRETVGEVLAEPRGGEDVPPVVVGGSVVPRWDEGLAPTVLAPDYRRIMDVLAGGNGTRGEAMDCRQLAAAIGLEPVPAKVEGVRSKAKRLAARGWLTEGRPGLFSVPVGRPPRAPLRRTPGPHPRPPRRPPHRQHPW
jgi:hypothetical protein